MFVVSWNVNGLRACEKKGFVDIFNSMKADVFCIQESRVNEDQLPESITSLKGYTRYTNAAEKKGYSGVITFSKKKALSVITDIGHLDNEGRVLCTEFDQCYLFNIYFPNSQDKLVRLDEKIKFNDTFLKKANELRKKKPVLLCGDLNVAHTPIDLTNPKSNEKNPGYAPEEREWFTKFLDNKYVDTFRMFTKEGGHYTWWSMRSNAREKNVGWRIDYWVVSDDVKDKVKSSKIHADIMGSDHCPVSMEIDL